MKKGILFQAKTVKSIQEFIESLKINAPQFNFGVRHVFSMKEEYKKRGVEVDEDFALYQIVICNFARSYKSMRNNIKRAAVLLEPKQIIVYNDKGVTTVNYVPFSKEFIREALPEDGEFAEGLYESCRKIAKLIEVSL